MNEQKPKNITLHNNIPPSDKIYKVELIKEDGWSVRGWNGRRGNTLLIQPKGSFNSYDEALGVYEALIKSKLKKGYKIIDGGNTEYVAPKSTKIVKDTSAEVDILGDFAKEIEKMTTGYMPQLLNEISEEEAEVLILNDDWCCQEKENAKRCGLSRNDKEIVASNKKGIAVGLSGIVVQAALALPSDFELDGEIFGNLYKVYDVFSLDGINLRGFSYAKRYEMLVDFVKGSKIIIPTKTAFTTAEKRKLYDWLKANNREGAVFKLKNSVHQPGRPNKGGEHLKVKFWKMCTCLVSKINAKRSVALQMLDGDKLVDVGNVSVKPSQDFESIVAGKTLVEIFYLYIIAKGGHLVQPELWEIRDDQDQPDDVSSLKINSTED